MDNAERPFVRLKPDADPSGTVAGLLQLPCADAAATASVARARTALMLLTGGDGVAEVGCGGTSSLGNASTNAAYDAKCASVDVSVWTLHSKTDRVRAHAAGCASRLASVGNPPDAPQTYD